MFKRNSSEFEAYAIGDIDHRPWGSYRVTDVGIEGSDQFCEKKIIIKPYQVLSLQRHQLRRENWRVTEGLLTVVLNNQKLLLGKDSEIHIPQKAVHCMANLTDMPVTVYEKQRRRCCDL